MRTSAPKVLIVDDRADKLLAIEVALDRLQIVLFKARSGLEAIEYCHQHEFAVIILDVRMPGMNGFETAAQIRKLRHNAHTPIIFVSAVDDPALITQGYALGAVDYIENLVPQILRAKVSVFVDLFRHREEISERKQIQAELEKAKAAAEQARLMAEQANAAKDRFIAALSHELRTPLTPVLALLPTLIEEAPDEAEIQADLRMIHRSVQLEARLIDELLDITSISRGRLPVNLEKTDLHRVAVHAVRAVSAEAKAKHIEVKLKLHAESHCVWADPLRLQQVVLSLLDNAVRYTPDGGAISLITKNETGLIQLVVEDSGIGFTDEQARRFFTAFERPSAKDPQFKFGGLGLGLFISQAILEQHGAELRAASDGPGMGASFDFELPVVSGTGDERISPVPTTVNSDGRPLRLLLVEDDVNTRSVLTRLLRRRGHQVESADTIQEALSVAEAHDFDLIVSDLGLPDGSGLDLMPELKRRYGLRGIAVTGFGTDTDAESSRLAGFSAHLVKPLEFSVLERTLRQVAQMSE
jgi:signal transduction histidine kinase